LEIELIVFVVVNQFLIDLDNLIKVTFPPTVLAIRGWL